MPLCRTEQLNILLLKKFFWEVPNLRAVNSYGKIVCAKFMLLLALTFRASLMWSDNK